MNTEIQEQLSQLALKRSTPFCYGCYQEALTGRCKSCGSDDLMKLTSEGCEYGTEWIVDHILKTELEPVDMDAAFEDMIRECYPETSKIGWLELDTVSILKEMDPVSWQCAQSDFESQELDEDTYYTPDNGSTYYRINEIEALLAAQP